MSFKLSLTSNRCINTRPTNHTKPTEYVETITRANSYFIFLCTIQAYPSDTVYIFSFHFIFDFLMYAAVLFVPTLQFLYIFLSF